jgi:nicotinamidase-related amidase
VDAQPPHAPGDKMKALLVIDMVKEYIYGKKPLIPIKDRKMLISNIRKVIDLAHEKGIPIIYINSAFTKDDPIMRVIGYRPQAMKGTEGAKTISELTPAKKDYVLEKRGYDGFWKSCLESLLKKLKITDIYITGEQTDCCIMETGITAAHLGFNVFVIEDCCLTKKEAWQAFALNFIKGCVGKVVKSDNLDW